MKNALRLFLAIPFQPDLIDSLSRVAEDLNQEKWAKHIRWVAPEKYHVTLHFIGNCAHERLPFLIDHIQITLKNCIPFYMQLGFVRLFPSVSHPHVLIVSIIPSTELFNLQIVTGHGIVDADFSIEKRAYLPHISLGRLIQGKPPEIKKNIQPKIHQCFVNEIALMSSEETEMGKIYKPLHYFKLIKNSKKT